MNIELMQADFAKKKATLKALVESTGKTCDAESRLMSAEEKAAQKALLDDLKDMQARIEVAKSDADMNAEILRITGDLKPAIERPTAAETKHVAKTIGAQFLDGQAFKWIQKTRGQRSARNAWTSPSDELYAATLTTDAASGGDLVVEQVTPGIQPLLFYPLTITELFASGTTDSNAITYMKETTFTNAADTVAQGATKPESTLIYDRVTDTVEKIAHWIPVTDEMLEDAPAIRSYIDARLILGLKIAEQDQLLNGSGTSPDLRGLLQRVGLQAALPRGADSNADALFKQKTLIETTAFTQVDGFVLHPLNWQSIQLTKNAAGNYLGTGPWAAPQQPMLWGIPVALSTAMVLNTALVGGFKQNAQIFRRSGIRIEVSNSHMDFFVKNLVAILAEERLALAVYRPGAFGTVTGLT